MKKVYCGECKHLRRLAFKTRCLHRENLEDNWEEKNGDFKRSPKDLNSDNSCKRFEKRR